MSRRGLLLVTKALSQVAVLAFVALSGCEREGDTVIIYANGGTGGAGTAGTGALRGGSAGGADDAAGQGGESASGSGDATAGGGQGAGSSTGGSSAGSPASGAGGGSGGQTYEGALFVEDFEDGDLEGWQFGPSAATFVTTTSTAANGSSRSLSTVGTDSNYYEGASIALDGLRPSKVSWWVQAAQGMGAYFEGFFAVSTDPDAGATQPLLLGRMDIFGMGVDGDESLSVDTLTLAGAPTIDEWHHFEVGIDWELGLYDVVIDGTSLGTEDFDPESHTGVWRIDLFNPKSDNVVLYDEIVLMP